MDVLAALFVSAAVFVASALQAATGIGFGLIGGPALLTTVTPATALITTGMLSIGISLGLIRGFRNDISWDNLTRFCLGGLAGLPIGTLIFVYAGGAALKVGAAAIVGFALFGLFFPVTARTAPSVRTGYAIGAISGVLSVALSMPGPVAAAYMMREGLGKTAVRATTLAFFLPSYTVALILQVTATGPANVDWRIVVYMAPATAIGLVVGRTLSHRLSERTFRLALQIVLAATIVSLVVSAVMETSP